MSVEAGFDAQVRADYAAREALRAAMPADRLAAEPSRVSYPSGSVDLWLTRLGVAEMTKAIRERKGK